MSAGSLKTLKQLRGQPYRDRDTSVQFNHPPKEPKLETSCGLTMRTAESGSTTLTPRVIAVSHTGIEYHLYSLWWVAGARNKPAVVS